MPTISQLPAVVSGTFVGSGDLVPIVHSGVTQSIQASYLIQAGGVSGQLQVNNGGSFAGAAGITYQANASPNFQIISQVASNVPLTVQGLSGQTGHLQEWQSNSGSIVATMDAGGRCMVGGMPPDANFNTGNYGLYIKGNMSTPFVIANSGTTTLFRIDGAGAAITSQVSALNGNGNINLTTAGISCVINNTVAANTSLAVVPSSGVSAPSVYVSGANSGTNANVILGGTVLAAAATQGFLYLPAIIEPPTGTPTMFSGTLPIAIGVTTGRLWRFVNGSWSWSG